MVTPVFELLKFPLREGDPHKRREDDEAICRITVQTRINTVFPSPAFGGTKESVTPCAEKSFAEKPVDCFSRLRRDRNDLNFSVFARSETTKQSVVLCADFSFAEKTNRLLRSARNDANFSVFAMT